MSKLQNVSDQVSREELTVGLFAIACIAAAIIASNVILRRRIRRQNLKSLAGAIDFEKHGRRRRELLKFRLGSIKPMVWMIIIAAGAFAYNLAFIQPQIPDLTSSKYTLTGRVTHTRDGDTIEVNGTPVRLANLDCAELGTNAGERAKVRMRALVRGETVRCKLTGERSYDRFIGSCYLENNRQLSEVMVSEGYCALWR